MENENNITFDMSNLIMTGKTVGGERKEAQYSDAEFEMDEFVQRVRDGHFEVEDKMKKAWNAITDEAHKLLEEDPFYAGLDQKTKDAFDIALVTALENTGSIYKGVGSSWASHGDFVMGSTFKKKLQELIEQNREIQE